MVRAIEYVNRRLNNKVGYRVVVDIARDTFPSGSVIRVSQEEEIYIVTIRAPDERLLRLIQNHEFAHILWDIDGKIRIGDRSLRGAFCDMYERIDSRKSAFRLLTEEYYINHRYLGHPWSSCEELFCSFFTISDLATSDTKIRKRFLRNMVLLNDVFNWEFERLMIGIWELYGMSGLVEDLKRIKSKNWLGIRYLIANVVV
ncbi:MAG: hypothetical protein QW465_00040 [Candidatus Anstonellales archaeon]